MTAAFPLLIFGTAFLLQITLFRVFLPHAPDTMLLATVYCGVKYMKIRGYQIGIIAGLVQDIFSTGLLGINLLSKGLIGFHVGWLRENHLLNPNSPPAWAAMILLGTVFNELAIRIYFAGIFGAPFSSSEIIYAATTQSLLNIILGLPLFYLLDRLLIRLRQKPGYGNL